MTSRGGFRDYALAFYARPGIAAACLALQDEAGCDVNVLLYLLFLAERGRRLGEGDLERIEAIARPWREAVVQPLRGVRRRLGSSVAAFEPALTAALRAEVKHVELAAERLLHERLEQSALAHELGVPATDRGACARQNLALYAKRLGVSCPGALAVIQNGFGQP